MTRGVQSPLGSALTVHGKPPRGHRSGPPDGSRPLPEPFASGLRLLDSLPMVPRHKLEPALNGRQFQDAWVPSKPVTDVVGLGPFQLVEHVAGQRLVFARNPHYFRRDAAGVQLPYLDRLTLAIVPDQNTEALRLEAGEIDLMSNGDIRPQDHAAFKRLADQGRPAHPRRGRRTRSGLPLVQPAAGARSPRARCAVDGAQGVRQAISCGVDRQAIVNTVYLGAAAPLYGPITPGNRRWYSAVPHAACADGIATVRGSC